MCVSVACPPTFLVTASLFLTSGSMGGPWRRGRLGSGGWLGVATTCSATVASPATVGPQAARVPSAALRPARWNTLFGDALPLTTFVRDLASSLIRLHLPPRFSRPSIIPRAARLLWPFASSLRWLLVRVRRPRAKVGAVEAPSVELCVLSPSLCLLELFGLVPAQLLPAPAPSSHLDPRKFYFDRLGRSGFSAWRRRVRGALGPSGSPTRPRRAFTFSAWAMLRTVHWKNSQWAVVWYAAWDGTER